MAKLAKIELVRDALAKQSKEGIDSIINSALEAATPLLETALRCQFPQAAGWAIYPTFPNTPNLDLYDYTRLVLELPSGFIDPATIAAKYASAYSELATGTAMDLTVAKLEEVRGYLTLFGDTIPLSQYIRVDYTAGFAEKADEIGKYYDGVPYWLQEAAKYIAIMLYDFTREANDKDVTRELPQIPQLALNLINPYLRTRQDTVRAV